MWAALIYTTGFLDGATAASDLDRPLTTSFLGATVEANPGEPSFAVTFNAAALIIPAVVFLLASRVWRALPPVRRGWPPGRVALSRGTWACRRPGG